MTTTEELTRYTTDNSSPCTVALPEGSKTALARIGALGALRSTVTDEAELAALGAEFPAASTTAPERTSTTIVPSLHEVTVTVNVVPDEVAGENTQPVAVPVFEKSAAVKPETAPSNVKVYDNEFELVGVDGAVNDTITGAVLSTVTDDEEFVDKLPASSSKKARYVPSTSPDNDTEVGELAAVTETEFHKVPSADVISANALTVTDDFTTYTVPVSAADTVALSLDFNDADVNVGATTVRSIVIVDAEYVEAGELFPAVSATAFARTSTTSVPSLHEVTVIVNVVPADADDANAQLVAVPEFEKSAAVKPDTAPSNVNVYDNVVNLFGDVGEVKDKMPGAVLSIVTVVNEPADKLPARSTTYSE